MAQERIIGWQAVGMARSPRFLFQPGMTGWLPRPFADCLARDELPDVLLLLLADPGEGLALRIATTMLRYRPLPMLAMGRLDPQARVALLRAGVGDVMAEDAAAAEVAMRAGLLLDRAAGRFGRLHFDRVRCTVAGEGGSVQLTPREAALLGRLLDARGRIVTQQTLWSEVLGIGFDPGTNGIAVHVHRVRAKLRALGLDCLRSVRGSGYRIDMASLVPLDMPGPVMAPQAMEAGEDR